MQATQWISIAQVVATAFVAIVAGFITWKMQSKQIDIAKGLQEIARGQHETAATKLRLELFERRNKAFEEVLDALDDLSHYSNRTAAEVLIDMQDRWFRAYQPTKYLFDESFYKHLRYKIGRNIIDHIEITNAFMAHLTIDEKHYELKTKYQQSLMEFNLIYEDLVNRAVPFLKVEKEKPLIEQEDQS